jgi:hypothetical protein
MSLPATMQPDTKYPFCHEPLSPRPELASHNTSQLYRMYHERRNARIDAPVRRPIASSSYVASTSLSPVAADQPCPETFIIFLVVWLRVLTRVAAVLGVSVTIAVIIATVVSYESDSQCVQFAKIRRNSSDHAIVCTRDTGLVCKMHVGPIIEGQHYTSACGGRLPFSCDDLCGYFVASADELYAIT